MMTIERHRRGLWIAVLAATACCALGAANAEAASIRMWSQAIVTGDEILLSDVCELQGFSTADAERYRATVIAPAPNVGSTDVLSIDSVRRALAADGVNMGAVVLRGATSCNISRPKRIKRPSADPTKHTSRTGHSAGKPMTLRDVIIKSLNEEISDRRGRVLVQFGRTPDQLLDLNAQEYQFDIRRTSGQALGLIGLEVTVLANGQKVQTVPLLVSASFVKPAAVAARPINLGATIQALDVHLVEITFTRFDQVGIDDMAAVIGQRARRFISAGEVVQGRDLEAVPLVKRGQIVDVLSRVGGVAITSAAKAMQSGAYGEIIELRAGDRSREKMSATVIGPGRVEVRAKRPGRSGRDTALAMGGVR